MPDPILIRADQGPIARLVLNEPASLNALSTAMLTRLSAELDDIAARPDLRVLLLSATGKAFCAGHDLKEIQGYRAASDGGTDGITALFDLCTQVMLKLARLPQPTIAMVQGIATAAGCQLAATCDLIVAADTARFGVNGVNIGLFCSTPIVALSRKIAPALALELAMTGDFLTAARAHQTGLVNRLAAPDQLESEAMALAQTLAAKLPSALHLGKRAFADQFGQTLPQAYATAGQAMVENLQSPDTAEGIAAFLTKRRPDWA